MVVEFAQYLVEHYAYLGLFVAGFLSALFVIFPSPLFLLAFGAGAVFNPVLVGIAFGLGSGLGEMSSYIIGRGGEALFLKKHEKRIAQIREQFDAWNPFLVIFAFSALPLPVDVVGFVAGVIKYDWKKALLALIAGKIVKFIAIAFAGFYGMSWVLQYVVFN